MNRLLFEKTGRAAYMSHLDLMRTVPRAFMRAGVAIKHTEGFNPHAFVSVAMPLSVYQESICELLNFELLPGEISLEQLPEKLNSCLPEGIKVLKAYDARRPFKQIEALEAKITLTYDRGGAAEKTEALTELFGRSQLVINKKTKSGYKDTDVRPGIKSVSFAAAGENIVECLCTVSAKEPVLNPEAVVTVINTLAPEHAPDFYRIMRLSLRDAEGKIFE
ncbi:MAG: DUF2344 domain-containing protein [Oscillospiraceae bacterium]|nr:DUF2344 domain-containing protein [Oscillospiraceae bacterium]